MLTDEVRKFTDDDVRAAVRLLESYENDIDRAVHFISTIAERGPKYAEQILRCSEVLSRMNYDGTFAVQLVTVTDSFREVLGLKSS